MRRSHVLVEVRDASDNFVRRMLPTATTCSLRLNGTSTGYLMVHDAHPAIPALMEPGARAALWMVTVDGAVLKKTRLMEGRVGDMFGDGPFGTTTIPVTDDFDMLFTVLGWPKPSAAITAQSSEYATYTGPSETRALDMIRENVTRLGLPWDVAASSGRGSTGTTKLRMDTVGGQVVDMLTADGLRLTMERNRDSGRWQVGVVSPTVYTRTLSAQSGLVTVWNWAQTRPTLTRVVVGGAGDGVDREFATVVDTALEAQLGMVLEGFVDAFDANAGDDLIPYGESALADAAAKAGITATLRESGWFRFPDTYGLGTKVPVEIGSVKTTDRITEIDVEHSTEAGFKITPKIGASADNPTDRLVRFVSNVAASVKKLERR